MSFFENFFTRKSASANRANNAPLAESVPNYASRIQAQITALNLSLETFDSVKNISLDLILSKTIATLKTTLVEYARLLEQVLVIRGVISLDSGPRKRSLSELVSLAKEKLKFYGGTHILETNRFLAKIQNQYLSDLDDKLVVKYVKSVKTELGTLALFIKKN